MENKDAMEKSSKMNTKYNWVFLGLAVSLILAVALSCFYGIFRNRAKQYETSPLENIDNVSWLYQNAYLLYKDLYNMQTDEQLDYLSLYLKPEEGYDWILELGNENEDTAYDSFLEHTETGEGTDISEQISADAFWELRNQVQSLKELFQQTENSFNNLNSRYDYIIRDNNTGEYLTNMSEAELDRNLSEQYFLLSFEFNNYGVATVGELLCGREPGQLRKLANEAIRQDFLEAYRETEYSPNGLFTKYCSLKAPVNCTVTYCISTSAWENENQWIDYWTEYSYSNGEYVTASYTLNSDDISVRTAYHESNAGGYLLAFLIMSMVLGLFLPVLKGTKPWREVSICRLSFEILFTFGVVVYGFFGELVFNMIVCMASFQTRNFLADTLGSVEVAGVLSMALNLLGLTAFFFCGWYLGVCARAVRELGIKEYIKQKSIIYRIFPFVKGKALGVYDAVCHFDVTKNAHKLILKVVLVNALILFVISSLWFGGLAITVIYSILLYVVLRKYISDLQKKYSILLHATNEIAQGNLNVSITEDLGVFEPFKPQVIRIQDGFKRAVEEEVKSQRMKAELITNVSHDLKTPLTAIITYVNLLKEEGITEEQRREYLETLERKSLRLKVLIEDLFEVSKANSQTITLNIMDVDVMNLVKQVAFEMSDKLSASNLDVRMNLTDEKVILPLDSQKTYRIYENLLGNVAKYAMPGTRVYINGFVIDDTVIITMKNISAQEITVDTTELTERFVRGDASRNTEGSGLGLAIVKSFTELQGGELSLEVDGDLFKVTTTWHLSE